jgi:D-alanyl-D-alanine carboxypeptidase
MTLVATLLAACAQVESPATDTAAQTLQADLEAFQATHAGIPGIAVAIVTSDGELISAATGEADPEGRPMTSDTPVRMASITKTFVAAAILRLAEEGRIDLDAPIRILIEDDLDALLAGDGYDTGAITVRHLLMHAGGLGDHFGSDAFGQAVMADPRRVWTAMEQLALMTELTDPVSAPGEAFAYSDSGYVILGQIIEGTTGMALGKAVVRLTKLDALGLAGIRWEGEAPEGGPARAHQYLGGMDTTGIHGSVDAFGGGGIIASAEDIARFFAALFKGDVFDRPETLRLMTEAPGHPEGSPYRIGLFETEEDGVTVFGHGGFWGTDVRVVPERGSTIATVSLEQRGIDDLRSWALRRAIGDEREKPTG